MMNKDVKLNLVVIVKDITTDYMLTQYCKFYSKYPNIVKLHAVIKSDKGEDVKRITDTFNSYFDDTDIRLSVYDKYTIEEETIYATDVLNYRMNDDEWFFMADIDEYVELEKINPEWFEKYNIIRGGLIDRIQEENQEFDDESSLFENYPVNSFLYNIIDTSYPIKLMFIKKQDFFIKVGCGHHNIHVNVMDAIDNLEFSPKYVPVYHFKWNYNFKAFLTEVINNTKDTKSQLVYLNEQRNIMDFFDGNDNPYDILRSEILDGSSSYVDVNQRNRDFCKVRKIKFTHID